MRWRLRSLDNLRTGTDATVLLHFTSGFVTTKPETRKLRSTKSYAATAKRKFLCAGFSSRFAGFLLQALAGNTNPLLLVGIGRTQRTNVRGNLANLALVRAADDQMSLLVHGDLNTFGNRKLDGMRFAEREIHDFAFELRAITDPDNVHVLLKSGGHAMNRIGNQSASETVDRAKFFRIAFDVQHAILLFEGNAVRHRNGHFALGALYIDFACGYGDFYARGQWNWLVSDA